MPVSNYDIVMLEVFRKAATEDVRIELPHRKNAVHLRHRLNNLRGEMRKENHHLRGIAEGVQLSIEYDPDDRENGPAVLVAHPADNTFLDAIRKAGVTAPTPSPEGSFPQEPEAQTTEEVLEEMFGDAPKEEPS